MKLSLKTFLLLFIVFKQSYAATCTVDDITSIPDIRLELAVNGTEDPVAIAHAGDQSKRLFVVEQDGRVRVVKDNKLVDKPFLDITDKVKSGGEKGLLGIAFHPQFRSNGKFYVNYTREVDHLETVVSEFRADKNNIVNPKSERILLQFSQPWGNHNGGQLAFGPDGMLYIGVGDGGSANDPDNNGQQKETLLGAILRIDVNHTPYGIPKDNPFVNTPKARPEIWAYGLRNPWRFSFDRETGQLYAADVGQDEVEEINIIEKGGNYGWRIMEGDICTPGVATNCDKTGLKLPFYHYRHNIGRSITGGYVYRGVRSPSLCGTYLYGDFVNQALWGLRYHQGKVVAHKTLFEARSLWRLPLDYFDDNGLLISTFGEDEDGEVYVAAYQSGRIYRIVAK
ncbi:MAG: PQQ-dependent sugar dehydrogenase [Gammaproteobacteria bacterium]|nr:PQQ-dependent sugar dehydrogenase [Gammaproteobacteria bacterium]